MATLRKGNTVRFNLKGIDIKEFTPNPINVPRLGQLESQFAVIASVCIKPTEEDNSDGYYNIVFGDGSVLLAVSGYHLTPYRENK
jgi:hypothetical protein